MLLVGLTERFLLRRIPAMERSFVEESLRPASLTKQNGTKGIALIA
jgi:hypothetical protein